MKKFGIFLIIIAFFLGVMGVRSYLRDNTYKKTSTISKATIISVTTKPFSGKAVVSIDYYLEYQRDGVLDSIIHKTTEEYSKKNPIPTIEELMSRSFYVRYVPINKRSETVFPNRVFVNKTGDYVSFYNRGFFVNMIVLTILAFILRRLFP